MRAIPITTLGEVRRVRAPGVLIELAYHDNYQDAEWIRNNINAIAQNLVLSLTQYFGIPFNYPQPIFTASVATMGGNLNIRYLPSLQSSVIGSVPNGAEVVVYAQVPNWSLVNYNGQVGYVSTGFLQY